MYEMLHIGLPPLYHIYRASVFIRGETMKMGFPKVFSIPYMFLYLPFSGTRTHDQFEGLPTCVFKNPQKRLCTNWTFPLGLLYD